ncbi:DUF2783 domain-containing protein [Halomonas sp. E19]|uniref:DUF2783 domain-containing protein n=1 Tax=Halomonas sp. E19 TaxID=3397247 RepID=UPI00403445FB
MNSTRATDFITPKSRVSRLFRDSVLELAEQYPFARRLVNSGRLSLPCRYDGSPLNGHEAEGLPLELRPGSPAKDAPIGLAGRRAWLLNQLGERFVLLLDGRVDSARAEALRAELAPLLEERADLDLLVVGPAPHALTELPRSRQVEDVENLIGERYGLGAGIAYLIRPDQHVTARWHAVTAAAVGEAMDRALGAYLAPSTVQEAPMPRLELNPNFTDPDAFYAALTELHRERSEAESERINARLILLLANHIGDQQVLEEALAIAGQATTQPSERLESAKDSTGR